MSFATDAACTGRWNRGFDETVLIDLETVSVESNRSRADDRLHGNIESQTENRAQRPASSREARPQERPRTGDSTQSAYHPSQNTRSASVLCLRSDSTDQSMAPKFFPGPPSTCSMAMAQGSKTDCCQRSLNQNCKTETLLYRSLTTSSRPTLRKINSFIPDLPCRK